MTIEGHLEYKKREFCKDVECPVQLLLETAEGESEKYESFHEICRVGCLHTAREFHYWLMDKGYLIVRPEKQEK